MKKMQFLKNNKGFTLVEMLIVMVIISVLVLLVIPNAGDIINSADETAQDANDRSCGALREAQAHITSIQLPETC